MPKKITLPTSAEVKEKLKKAGWTDVMGDGHWWYNDQRSLDLHLSEPAHLCGNIAASAFSVPLDAAVEVAGALGIAPPGFRLVPEDVAQDMASKMLILAEWFEKRYKGLVSGTEVQDDLRKWASTLSLSGKEGE